MAASSTAVTAHLLSHKITHNYKKLNDDATCSLSLLRQTKFHRFSPTTPSNKVLVVRRARATPEVAGDLLSSLSLPPIPPGFQDNPWLAGVGGLALGLPLIFQKLVALLKKLDEAAATVHAIAAEVGGAEGKLKQVVDYVEQLNKDASNSTYKVSPDMEKVLRQHLDFSSMIVELQESHKREMRAMSSSCEEVREKLEASNRARERAEANLAEVIAKLQMKQQEIDALKTHCNTYRITADRHRADLILVHQMREEAIRALQAQIENLENELRYVHGS